MPTLDPRTLSPAERARSEQLLAAFKSGPGLLSVLDSAVGPPGMTALAPVDGAANGSGNGTDGNTIAPPSATQR
jgi:hypothetical protein